MTELEIAGNRQEFKDLCRKYITREGIEPLLTFLEEKTDFYTAPSSTNYHLNQEGGLCRHSINVLQCALTIKEHVLRPAVESGVSAYTKLPSDESVALCALLHDLCKTGMYHRTEKFRKDAAGRWETYPAYEIKDSFPLGHGEKSCVLLHKHLKLTREELLAIRWHMGGFDCGEFGTATRYAFREASEASPLVALLQGADLLAAQLMEKTTKY